MIEAAQLAALTVAVKELKETVSIGFERIESSQAKQWEQININRERIAGMNGRVTNTQWAVGILLAAAGVVAAVLVG